MLLAAALCWSIGGVLIKFIPWSPLAVASARGLIAAAFLAVVARPLRFTWSPLQVAAALAYAACTITFVAATKLTTAANAILLQYTAPVYVAFLGAWLLGERAQRIDWITILVALGGMALFFADELAARSLLGNAIAIGSGICFAVMTVLLRKQKAGSPVESIVLGNLIAGLIGLPWVISAPLPTAEGGAALIALGIVQLGVSYWLYSRAIRHVTAMEAVLIPVMEPILNPVWTMLVIGERPGPWAILGGAIVLGAVTARAFASLRWPASKSSVSA